MPRYEDRYNGTRLYVGHLSSRTRSRDLEDLFSRYGRVRDVDMKRDYAFVDFSDPRDADDARYALSGRDVDGSRITVEFSRGVPRGPGGSRGDHGGGDRGDRGDRGGGGSRPVPGSGRCFNCGVDGHWARDCKSGDWKNKCYRCGERGHVERNCQNSPKKLRRGRSYSRSPSPRRGRSPSRSRSYSRSRSPPKRERAVENVDRSRSPRHSRSPKRQKASPPVSRGRKHSLTPEDRSPRGRVSLSPRDDDDRRGANGSDYGGSPRPKSISPVADKADRGRDDLSPMEANGGEERSPSPAPRSKRSAREDGEDDYRASPRVSE